MTLKTVFEDYLKKVEWSGEIEHDDGDNTDFISTDFNIDGQPHRLILITDEDRKWIKVVVVAPMKVPGTRREVTAVVLNALNTKLPVGNLEVSDDGTVYYRWALTVEGANASTQQFFELVDAGGAAFDELRSQAIGAASFSKQTADAIIKDYLDAVTKLGASSEEAPSEL